MYFIIYIFVPWEFTDVTHHQSEVLQLLYKDNIKERRRKRKKWGEGEGREERQREEREQRRRTGGILFVEGEPSPPASSSTCRRSLVQSIPTHIS